MFQILDNILKYCDFNSTRNLKATNQFFDVAIESTLVKKSKLVITLKEDEVENFETYIAVTNFIPDSVTIDFKNCPHGIKLGCFGRFLMKFGEQIKHLDINVECLKDIRYVGNCWKRLSSLETLNLNTKLVYFPSKKYERGHRIRKRNYKKKEQLSLKTICLPYLCLYGCFIRKLLHHVNLKKLVKICSPVDGEYLTKLFCHDFYLEYDVFLEEHDEISPSTGKKTFYYTIVEMSNYNLSNKYLGESGLDIGDVVV